MLIRVVIAMLIMRDMMRMMMTCQSQGGVDWSRRGRNYFFAQSDASSGRQ